MDRRGEIDHRAAHDLKLRLDRESQDVAEAVILQAFPDDGVLGEEGRAGTSGARVEWIVDPIDGTVNFAAGLPFWCSSVAVRVDGEVRAGCVYAPVLQDCYTATRRGPACRNGVPIAASSESDLAESIVLTGLAGPAEGTLDPGLCAALAHRTRKVRVVGSAALDLCCVAAGIAQGYVEQSIYLWDVAAGGLIAERAGAVTRMIERAPAPRCAFLAAAPDVFADLLRIAADREAAWERASEKPLGG